ncbi:3-beta-hydroxysteroid-Delta(8),Delta(7)-isomerase [Paramyrothecium foliicola]|nr:3-beta-hydroxysteroid-Delta(8),Delta(7)-isomerase [Paramyrothecium foliicola]
MNATINFIPEGALHPYFPLGVDIPGYQANSLSAAALVGSFAAGCAVIFLTTYYIIQVTRPATSNGAIAATLWFVLCGCIHLFFEGYFARNFPQMAAQVDLFGQLWKEYSLSDSRYLTQDPFVVCMEAVTALFWGPLSFVCAWAIVADHPIRHPLQLVISLGQLYGDVLYYATSLFQDHVFGVVFYRPESFYFWAYFVLCNAFWIVIPLYLMAKSIAAISSGLAKLQELEKAQKRK